MNEFWVDRSQEGRQLAERLLASSAPITVLYGASESGKTDFIRDCVMPLIPRASYRNADLANLDKVSAGEYVFVDSFEEFLLHPDSGKTRRLAESLRLAERQSFKLVLLVMQDYLNRLFQLQQDVPRLMEAAIELPAIDNAQLFERFLSTAEKRNLHLSEKLRNELAADLETCSARLAVDPELFAIVTDEFQKMQKSDREIGTDDYEGAGRLMGILESHVESVLDSVGEPATRHQGVVPTVARPVGPTLKDVGDRFDPQMGWAVLDSIARNSTADEYSLLDVANRFDVSVDIVSQLVDWLQKTTSLVRKDKLGRIVVRPRQLGTVMETRRQRDLDADEHLTLMLRQGVRHFIDTATCLSESSFRKIHARRTTIRTNEVESKLMLRCALAYEDARSPQATDHWLRRLQNPDAALEILLDSAFDSRDETRERAAARLSDFNRPEVRRQLHMLALRDKSQAVRSQAIDSLGAVKDEALRNELIQEVNDPHSPYRLPAIDTLRIFNDQETIQTLVKIIQDPKAPRSEAAARAVQVLGCQDAVQAADALLKIAMEDSDWRTRHDAASALGFMKSEEPLRAALDKLRFQQSGEKVEAKRPLRYALLTPFYATSALAVVLWTFFVHGLLLATLGRWRLGIVLTIVEFVGFIMIGTSAALAGVWILVTTLLIGLLVPTRIVLKGRSETKSHGRYRQWADVALGMVDSLTVFLIFPGLAPLLSGHIRRGLTLIGVGVAGAALVLGALFFQERFAPFVLLSGVFTFVPTSMILLGVLLLAIAYISGLGFTLVDSFMRPERKEWRGRQGVIHLELLSNPVAARVVAAKLTSGNSDESAWAASLIRRYRTLFQKTMDTDSVGLLKTAVPAKGWRVTREYIRAACDVWLSTFPKYVVAAGLAGVLTLTAFSAVTYELYENTPQKLMSAVNDKRLLEAERREAVRRLRILAVADERQEFAADALAKTIVRPDIDDSIAGQIRQALKEVVDKRPETHKEILKTLTDGLKDPDTNDAEKKHAIQASVIATFQVLQLKPGAQALRDFIEVPSSAGPVSKEYRDSRPDPLLPLKFAAIAAIGNMKDLGHEAIEILESIDLNDAIAKDLRNAATKAISEFDPLVLAETELEHQDWANAILHAEGALQKSKDDETLHRIHKVLSRSHLRLGTAEWQKDNYEEAKSHFNSALKYGDSDDAALEISLGLDLAFMAHENIALKDADGYMDTFEIASDLKKLEADNSVSKITIESNLSEANLTVGRYEEADRIAESLLQNADLDNETKINMLLIHMMAHALKGDQNGAAEGRRELMRFYDSLPKGFSNSWSYTGTRHYVEQSKLSDEQKREILALMTKIAKKS